MTREVNIPIGDARINGDLTLPDGASGIVLFAHGSGSSRKSPRNRWVAQQLNNAGLATLLMDLLTEREEQIDMRTAELRFDIPLLAGRVVGSAEWLASMDETKELPAGYFGSSTGAAAALIAAARGPEEVKAVVSRGGRPDLASDYLPDVEAPTLLIVGGRDTPVIDMNKSAMARMETDVKLDIVEGATHLFEEEGKLEEVAGLAADWFKKHLN